jgi:hypothetical protein
MFSRVDSISFEPRASQSCWKVAELAEAGALCFFTFSLLTLYSLILWDDSSANVTNQVFLNPRRPLKETLTYQRELLIRIPLKPT